MGWEQILALIAGNAAIIVPLFLWVRSESRADHRELRADHRELESWTKEMLSAIQQEIKDFHGRLCAIEERNKTNKAE